MKDSNKERTAFCSHCRDMFPVARLELGYDTCIVCGDRAARRARKQFELEENAKRDRKLNKHYYDIVNSDGDLIMEITSSFTNLSKEEYFNDHLAGEVMAAMSHAFGKRVFVASWRCDC